MSENEVLRRVQDLLVGDVVAHNGARRKVERVYRDALSDVRNQETTSVVFEDSEEREGVRGMHKVPTRFQSGLRLLLLESHYSAAVHTNCRCSVEPEVVDRRNFRKPWGSSFTVEASAAKTAVEMELRSVHPGALVHVVLQVVG